MTLADALSELASRGVTLSIVGDNLRCRAIPGVLTPELRAHVASYKSEILSALRRQSGVNYESTPLAKVSREGNLPLSHFQQRLWFIDQLEPGTTVYNIPSVFRMKGAVDYSVLSWSLREIVRRHESLRSSFETVDGRPVQRICENFHLAIPITDLMYLSPAELEAEVERRIHEDASTSFSLSTGPLVRAQIVRVGPRETVGIFCIHHIVSDGWSLTVLVNELRALYAARLLGQPSPLPALPMQYVDFAAWHHAWLSGERLEHQLSFWRRQLDGCPRILALPTDHRRPSVQSHRGATLVRYLPPTLTARVKEASRTHGERLFPFLLTVFQTLMFRYTSQEEFLVGTSIANRDREEFVGMVGFFVNWLALRTDLKGDPTFSEALQRTKSVVHDSFVHKDLPFERLITEIGVERDLSRQALFQVMFVLHVPMPELDLSGVEVDAHTVDNATAKMDLTLFMRDTPRGLECEFEYSTDLFEATTIERMAAHFIHLCNVVTESPDIPISRLPLLSDDEKRTLLRSWTGVVPADGQPLCVHELVEAQVSRTPDAIALTFEGQDITYRQFNERANRLAHYLRELGVGPGIRVGVCLHRSIELLVSLLGVLKAGGAYVPLDPSYPADRLAYMMSDAAVPVLLTQQTIADELQEVGAHTICVDTDEAAMGRHSANNLVLSVSPEDVAYVIYTSGSTGKPKGVLVPHRGVSNFLHWLHRTLDLAQSDRVVHKTPISFDASIRELFSPFLAGARLVIARPEGHRDPEYLAALLEEHRVTTLHLVPSLLRALLDEPRFLANRSLRSVMCGGEALPIELMDRFRAALPARLYNVYGPTEASVDSTMWRCDGTAPTGTGSFVPIGTPIDRTQLYILDVHKHPVPRGVTGELYIGGLGVASGYLNQPGLTAEAFVSSPFCNDTNEVLYRTGDRVRALSNGDLEFIGRIDEQVKVRGYRIELGEIQRALERHSDVEEAIVAIHQDKPGDDRLVAYLVPAWAAEGSLDRLRVASWLQDVRARVKNTLPDYMVPTAFVVLDSLPLNPSGKIDRRALPAPTTEDIASVGMFVAPSSPIACGLADIWAEILGVSHVGATDNFFDLGGHSLLATMVISRILNTFRVEVPLRRLFEAPTLLELATFVEDAIRKSGGITAPPLMPTRRDDGPLPLSFAQQRLWFLNQLEPDSPFYNIPLALRLSGALDVQALARAVSELVRRHEALRTTFAIVDNEPVQVVSSTWNIELPLVEFSDRPLEVREAEVLAAIRAEALLPFDLADGPVLRASLLRVGDEDHVFLVNMHHIVSDGWSLGVCVRELTTLYAAFSLGQPSPLPEPRVQYADFARWQRGWLTGETLQAQLRYWRDQIAGCPPELALYTDRPRPRVQSYRGSTRHFRFPLALFERVHTLCREEHVTLFMMLLAAYEVILYRYSGQEDFAVGTAIASRSRAETEGLVGFFVNTLVMRADLSGGLSFRTLLRNVREVALGAYAHQDLSFEQLVTHLEIERDLSRQAVFQVMFVLQNAPLPEVKIADLNVRLMPFDRGTSKFDLTLFVTETPEGPIGTFEYNTDIFESATIDRMAANFLMLLEGIVASPDSSVAEIPILSDAERMCVVELWNDTATPYPIDRCLHEFFEERARQMPQKTAVAYCQHTLTYGDLDRRANQLAHYLRRLGVGPDVLVSVAMDRSLEYVVAILAVLKAGGAYVPIDPMYPRDRIVYMIEDSAAPVLLTQDHIVGAIPFTTTRVVRVDSEWPTIASENIQAPTSGVTPDNLAYVIYTSGSTGKPKGVMVPHRGVCNFICWLQDALQLTPEDRVLHKTPFSFDASIRELFSPFMVGATLILAKPGGHRDSSYLAKLIFEERVTTLHLVPSLLAVLLDEPEFINASSLRRVMSGGESLSAELSTRFTQNTQAGLFNVYGPTEASVDSTVWQCPTGNVDHVPIGQPIANTRCYILDANLAPVPIGVSGELHIAGHGVARGYWNQSDLTAQRFIRDPFSDNTSDRLYKTGDCARWLSDGNIALSGRFDHQIKIRGFRIELGEIEATLDAHPSIDRSTVIAREDDPGDRRIVAYVTLRDSVANAHVPATDEGSKARVDEWRSIFENNYENAHAPHDPQMDLIGWDSSYTRNPIPEVEMREWVDRTVERILALRPKRVLELGCGTGLLLFRIAPFCEHYCAHDFAASAIDSLRPRLETIGLPNVTLLHRSADNLEGYEPESFDLVILNSVIQYFPDLQYLVRVLDQAAAVLTPGGSLFIGDVRCLSMQQAFHTSVQLFQSSPSRPLPWIVERVRLQIEREKELVIDPGFFATLEKLRDWIGLVDVELRRGTHVNEMTKFRYDVTLWKTPKVEQDSYHLRTLVWTGQWSTATLRHLLIEERPESIWVRGIPNARVNFDFAALEYMRAPRGIDSAGELRSIMIQRDTSRDVDPEAIWALGEQLGFTVRVGWSARPMDATFDATFVRGVGAKPRVVPVELASAEAALPLTAYGNHPCIEPVRTSIGPQLRDFLLTKLPEHLVPNSFVVLDTLPLNSNGKIDRAALPAPDVLASPSVDNHGAPRDLLEEALVALYREVLGTAHVGIHDDFFEMGGHSLLATQVVSRIRRDYGVSLPLRTLFEQPTVAALAIHVARALRGREIDPSPPLAPMQRGSECPLSFAQQRLWFLNQVEPESPFYNMTTCLRLIGPIDAGAFSEAVDEILRRHEGLRTRFVTRDGCAVQEVVSPPHVDIPVSEIQGLTDTEREAAAVAVIKILASQPFDLTDAPLLRIRLLRITELHHVLVVVMHHIISDGWSMGVFVRELAVLYDAFASGTPSPLPPLAVQYADFALWQRQRLDGNALNQEIAYWSKQLEGSTVLHLPTDRPRPPIQSYHGATHTFRVPQVLSARLCDLSKREGVTLFMLLLSTFEVLLYRYSRQEHFVIGTAIANRNHAGVEGLIGFFVNALALHADLRGNPTFRQLLFRVRESALGAYAHQDLPFEKLVEAVTFERDISRPPLFQVSFLLQNAPLPRVEVSGLEISELEIGNGTAKLDLNLDMRETSDGLRGELEFNTDLFDLATIERMASHYCTLLESIVADPDQTVARLTMLSKPEQHRYLTTWNQTDRPRQKHCVLPALFEEQATRLPDSIAIVSEGRCWTFGDLNRRANQLAHYLRGIGVTPDTLVGLLMDRSFDFIVGILGILKAGGAYVPLDPGLPKERIAFYLEDTSVSVLVTKARFVNDVADPSRKLVCLDRDAALLSSRSSSNPAPNTTENNLAYVIFTSGSSGVPKGVLCTHRAICDRIFANQSAVSPLTEEDRFFHCYSFSFDGSVICLFWPLLSGARVVLANDSHLRDVQAFARELIREGITVFDAMPALLQLVFKEPEIEGCTTLRQVLTGGEECTPEVIRTVLQRKDVIFSNQYGPTEAGVNATSWTASGICDAERYKIPIGRPLENTRVYVLDAYQQPVPTGVPGELYIGGIGLARGYLNRPELTLERFVTDPFVADASARMYRSGDLVRYLVDGNLEFLGRVDEQVKIRGFRIELGEIEAVLAAHAGVSQVAVAVHKDSVGEKRLVAYVAPRAEINANTLTDEAIRNAHVDDWRTNFDESYVQSTVVEDPTWNITGWNSTYTGLPLTPSEMNEYVDATVARILSPQPRRVLEIGCGTGLLLFRIAPHCEAYVGCDISDVVVGELASTIAARGLSHVTVRCHAAHELGELTPESFDTVILSSTIQYFPSIHYLIGVLDQALRVLKPGGQVFLGDVRNLQLREAFHASVSIYRATDSFSVDDLRQTVRRSLAREAELVVDPAFFNHFTEERADVAHVRIDLKRGLQRNEMVKFRYDVILKKGAPQSDRLVNNLPEFQWSEGDATSLSALAADHGCTGFIVRAIQNARVDEDVILTELLGSEPQAFTIGQLRAHTRQRVAESRSVDPETIWALAQAKQLDVQLCWSEGTAGARGCFDAIFTPTSGYSMQQAKRPRNTDSRRPWHTYATDPLRSTKNGALVAALRQALPSRLPDYMIPAEFVVMDDLPRLNNGKVNRAALPAPEKNGSAQHGAFVAAGSSIERALSDIWSELLGVERVGITDDFFALGGHSLLATQLVSRIRTRFNVTVPLVELFRSPTIAGIAEHLELASRSTMFIPPLVPISHSGDIPATASQKAMYKSERPAALDNMPVVMQVDGPIDERAFTSAINQIVSRHEALRSTFVTLPSADRTGDRIVQRFLPTMRLDVPLTDLSNLPDVSRDTEIRRLTVEHAREPFDLAIGPLVRLMLVRRNERDHVLLFTAHQSIFDGWSFGVFFSELSILYEALARGDTPSLPTVDIQFSDVMLWRSRWLHDTEIARQLNYWKQTLDGYPPLEIPTDHPRPLLQNYESANWRFVVSAGLKSDLVALAMTKGTTLFVVLLTAFETLLYQMTKQSRFAVGTAVSGRGNQTTAGVIGSLVNTLALPADLSGSTTFDNLLERNHRSTLSAYENQDVALDHVLEHLGITHDSQRHPLFQVLFVVNNTPREFTPQQGLVVRGVEPEGTSLSKYDLRLSMTEANSDLIGAFQFSVSLFHEETIIRAAKRYNRILEAMVADPSRRIVDRTIPDSHLTDARAQ